MSRSYPFRLEMSKLILERDLSIYEVAERHKMFHTNVIGWRKAFREKGRDGVKSPYSRPETDKILRAEMKNKALEIAESTGKMGGNVERQGGAKYEPTG